ncbi:DASH complex, subunit Spc19 [Teratosphaeria nubilosa]|uniref:DASH complex subunit SPC19 n=1 Tax=Teratosphaeria nubilosa TaxID=161662 RepID=A0A6G1LN72_9PEZI|nr:DASH complex, subunit Spc19 [Teratosphaeria nubilosa]
MDSSTQQHALQGCVSSLRSSMQLLEASISILDSGVSDYPRLSKVLQTTRHFELVSEHDLTTAQSTLLSEITPEVTNLLSRVETYLDKLERREQSLIAKAELQEGRLSRSSLGHRNSNAGGNASRSGGAGLTQLDEMKFQQMKAKKGRLSFAISRLELEAGQRERQLRKSMAFQ